MRVIRLKTGDRELSRELFATMADVFELAAEPISDVYIERLLAREEFWALAAIVEDQIVGGLTAHTLPMTRTESYEIFIYDIAVRADRQRQGIGRLLMAELRKLASMQGIHDVFVAADDEDQHALEFYRALGGAESPVTHFTYARP
jgi:aminoglycoside 3-N-acetyltransferase I